MKPAETYRIPGFLANGVHAGIKVDGRHDLAMIFSTCPAKAAGVFTTNCFKAAPVLLDMERIRAGSAQAVIANSGYANAATGPEGFEDALAVSLAASTELGIADDLILVASTGVIGFLFRRSKAGSKGWWPVSMKMGFPMRRRGS
jgi:glutamate N-acetyltransferase/amino-acid N-acetyltransferase